MRVLAIDPGERVGWARADVTDKGKCTNLKTGITPLKDMALRLVDVFETYDVVIVETWRLSAGHAKEFVGSSFPTVQFIGMLRMLSWMYPYVKVEWQAPTVKTTAVKTAKKLNPKWHKLMTAPGAHQDTHDQDAVMHLWHWVWRTRIYDMEVQA